MEVLFIEYPKCSTCKKAKKWLEENEVVYTDRNIIENTPTKIELKKWIKNSNLDTKKWFNTSGMKYRELKLKEKLIDMSDDDKLDLLSSDGMLIKRPLLVTDEFILTGFREKEWKEKFTR